MEPNFNPNYPSVEDLRRKARKRIPRFAFEYLDEGCNAEVNLVRNTRDIRAVQLKPFYLRPYAGASLETELFGTTYAAPFGVAPVGLQGLMWPRASQILAKAAFENQIPFILSNVATASLEEISEITEGNAWFQLYHPVENALRNDLLNRASVAGYPVLVIVSDVPVYAYRPKDIKNGLAIPPKMTLSNMIQILGKPGWAIQTLLAGQPEFATVKPYIPRGTNLRDLGLFMKKTFNGRLNEEKIKAIRDKWKGKLVLKGVACEEDAEMAVALGLDGIVVSNHGGRQLDAGESTIKSLNPIVKAYRKKITIMMDSGIRSGSDIACTLASGAEFTLLGKSFMYSVAALGKAGGEHAVAMLKMQLRQVMEQIGCEKIADLPEHLI